MSFREDFKANPVGVILFFVIVVVVVAVSVWAGGYEADYYRP
ncbi:hypothetical protein [Labrys sp. WJW]|nr:hypothetical protein [Labrys sp. WJW]